MPASRYWLKAIRIGNTSETCVGVTRGSTRGEVVAVPLIGKCVSTFEYADDLREGSIGYDLSLMLAV